MSPCRISKLEIQGFRAFGRSAQTLNLPSALAAVWGPNSQGKTSLAEAVEFLLTAQIVRRTLMASSPDDFAATLRHAHLPEGTLAFVEAVLVETDGVARTVKRVTHNTSSNKSERDPVLTNNVTPTTTATITPA